MLEANVVSAMIDVATMSGIKMQDLRPGVISVMVFLLLNVVACTPTPEGIRKEAEEDIIQAAWDRDIPLIDELLSRDASLLNTRFFYNQTTLLHIACTNVADYDTAAYLLGKKLSPNLVDDLGRSTLHYAYKYSARDRVIDLLVAAGANPDLKDIHGYVPKDYGRDGIARTDPKLLDER